MTQPPTPDAILQTGLAFWPAKTLLSAIELGVFTELARGAETLEWLRTRLGLHPRSARDFFDTLVALGFLTAQRRPLREHRRRPTCSSTPQAVLHRRHPRDGQRAAVSLLGRPDGGLQDGAAAERDQARHDRACSKALYADPARLKQFLEAMTGLSRGANLAIARSFPWSGLPDVRRRRHGAGRSRRADRARQPAPASARASISRRWDRFSPSMSPASALRSG